MARPNTKFWLISDPDYYALTFFLTIFIHVQIRICSISVSRRREKRLDVAIAFYISYLIKPPRINHHLKNNLIIPVSGILIKEKEACYKIWIYFSISQEGTFRWGKGGN